jgi:hypothetical protein
VTSAEYRSGCESTEEMWRRLKAQQRKLPPATCEPPRSTHEYRGARGSGPQRWLALVRERLRPSGGYHPGGNLVSPLSSEASDWHGTSGTLGEK